MQLLDLYRYLNGYIAIKVSGGFPERFLNLCTSRNIFLWDLKYQNNEMTCKLCCKDFHKLRAVRRKSAVKIKIIKKTGAYFYFKKREKRKGLLISAVFFILFSCLMSQFIWNIDVTGSEKLSKEEIIDVAESLGLRHGTFKHTFNSKEVCRKAVNQSDGKILWMAINIKGSTAVIEVRDYENDAEKKADETACDITADFDGIVLSVDSYSGVRVANVGDKVKKGDLLITGISENDDMTVNYQHASGKISALHKKKLKTKLPQTESISKFEIKSTFYHLNLFAIKIPLSPDCFKKHNNIIIFKSYLKADEKSLPLSLEKIISVDLYQEKTETDFLLVADKFTNDEFYFLKNSYVTSREYNLTEKNGEIILEAEYESIDFMGQQQEIKKVNQNNIYF